MLLPDKIHPEECIYYNGYVLLEELQKEPNQEVLDLFANAKKANNMSFCTYVLCLDWLYLIDAAKVDEQGIVRKCL